MHVFKKKPSDFYQQLDVKSFNSTHLTWNIPAFSSSSLWIAGSEKWNKIQWKFNKTRSFECIYSRIKSYGGNRSMKNNKTNFIIVVSGFLIFLLLLSPPPSHFSFTNAANNKKSLKHDLRNNATSIIIFSFIQRFLYAAYKSLNYFNLFEFYFNVTSYFLIIPKGVLSLPTIII